MLGEVETLTDSEPHPNMRFITDLKRRREFLTLVIILVMLTLAYGILGSQSWAVDTVESPTGFCEEISAGIVKEPVNTISNLGYIGVGLFILWRLPNHPKVGKNPMVSHDLFPIIYAVGAIYIGVGSFAMHGTNTHFGTTMDWTGMLFFISFPVYYNMSRIYSWSKQTFLKVFITVFVITVLFDVYASGTDFVIWYDYSGTKNLRPRHLTRGYLWSLYIGVWIIQECKNISNNNLVLMISIPVLACLVLSVDAPLAQITILCLLFAGIAYGMHIYGGVSISRTYNPYLWLGAGSYVLGNMLWRLGRQGSSTCDPDSLLQYHALWHILTAISVLYFYLYFTTEVVQEQNV